MKQPNIAIVSTNRHKYSETFIHRHISELPGKVHLLFDGYLPAAYSADRGLTGYFFKANQDPAENLYDYLVEHQIDVVLAEYGPSGVEVAPICAKTKIPLVVHFHGYDAFREDVLTSYGPQYREMFEKAAAVIGVSQPMMKQLEQLGCPVDKLHLVHYGIDTATFQYTSHPRDPHLVSCGRFVEKKAPDLVLRTFALLVKTYPNARLTMIGDGPLLASCKLFAQELGLSEKVTFTGVLTQPEIAKVYAESAVFLQHSLMPANGDSEGTPLTIMEAAAAGLPIVSTRHGGIPYIVKDCVTGLLVNEGDWKSVAAQITYLLENPERAVEMGKAGSKKINASYTLAHGTEQLYAVLCGVNQK